MGRSLLPEAVERYIDANLVKSTEVERRLYDETMRLERSAMASSPEVGAVLALLVKLVGAKRIVEIGVFTGYATLKMAMALPPDGRLVACDVIEEWTAIGQSYWVEAGVADRIDLRIAPALETLAGLEAESFDMAFIDADKENYHAYYERCLKLIRSGGLIVLDNLLWDGKVADLAIDDADTVALRQVGLAIASDPRVDAALLTVGDGLMLARVK
ncbi:MAG: putative O-methyltransferase [Fimbriimonadaceae bacterium]|nr:putative O-methyltransferase [Fimbriimonadaceae bacterium]